VSDGEGVLRLAIVEDDDLYRNLLTVCLARQPSFEIVGSFANSDEALADIPSLRSDAAILDIDLPGSMDGVSLGVALRQRQPELGIVLLSNHALPQLLSSLPPDSASGWSYLLKKSVSDVKMLARAISGSVTGLVTLDTALVAGMRARDNSPLMRLTRRQREVLELIAQGFTNAAIAEALVLTEKSVEKHVSSLYDSLDIDRGDSALTPRVQAVLLYLNETRSRPPGEMPRGTGVS
jgi:DNA-binding NarL/FixJ family response regulator